MYERSDEWIQRISLGDRDALNLLYEQHHAALLSFLLTITRDFQLAEEILQDTLFAVWTGASSFDGRSSGKTWIFGVARRRARDLLRRKRIPWVDLESLESLRSRAPDPADAAIAAADGMAIERAFGELSISCREVLTHFFFHGLTYQEIAEILEIPIGTAKSRLFTAKRELRIRLESYGADPS